VTGELSIHEPNAASSKPSALQESDLDREVSQADLAALPDWIARERWGWLSLESVRRLVQKAGSEDLASKKLEMILYNETHGPLERRVRSRGSVLAYDLSSPQAEIWPNDDGFETLERRKAIWEQDRARREKALAEEALQVRQEADQATLMASLSEA